MTLDAQILSGLFQKPIVLGTVRLVAFDTSSAFCHVGVGCGMFEWKRSCLKGMTVLTNAQLVLSDRVVGLLRESMATQASNNPLLDRVLRMSGE